MSIVRDFAFRPWLFILFLLTIPIPAVAADARALNVLIDSVFAANVEDGYVDYPAISRNVRFHKYIEALVDVDLSELTNDQQKIAFWLNVYNTLAVKNVIDGVTPVTRIGRIKFFRTADHRVAGSSVDLNSIESTLLEFGDARVRLAMVHGAYTAPNLRSGAYRADELDQQLNDAVRNFVNDNRKNRYSDALRRASLSELFERHQDEFGGSDEAILVFIAQYVNDKALAEALASNRYEIKYLEYEWGINGHPM
jgi:hypothetical protein